MNKRLSNDKFADAARAMETRTKSVAAYVIMQPGKAAPERASESYAGRVVISYPRGKSNTLRVIAWMPEGPDGNENLMTYRHTGHAGGGGYDKSTAAMGGAHFWNLNTNSRDVLIDQGHDWRRQLEKAGYYVVQAC